MTKRTTKIDPLAYPVRKELWRRITIIVLAAILAGSLYVRAVRAQAGVISASAQYTFGEEIVFRGVIPTGIPVESATLFFVAEGELQTHTGAATWDERGQLLYIADLTQSPIRAFSTVVYWFEVTKKGGGELKSERGAFYYEDNRFDWQARESKDFRVHWYEGDTAFAQSLLDVAELGLANIQVILPLKLNSPVDIYAYASAEEMRATLQHLGKSWVGAHTDPDLGVMVVSLPRGPEQRLEMERQIPHELMHLMLYQRLGAGYGNIPIWLNEGLASIAELYPNPDYLILLNKAVKEDNMLPMASLCETFPRDASGAFLAYAEATSFTRFLYQQYGTAGLESLARAYADGLSCERGVQIALDRTLTQLERQWRQQAFREDALLTALTNLSPWIVILALVLIFPLGLTLVGTRKNAKNGRDG